jgi:hypothetical protein
MAGQSDIPPDCERVRVLNRSRSFTALSNLSGPFRSGWHFCSYTLAFEPSS